MFPNFRHRPRSQHITHPQIMNFTSSCPQKSVGDAFNKKISQNYEKKHIDEMILNYFYVHELIELKPQTYIYTQNHVTTHTL
jgi:hypothetical protein